MLLGYQVGSVIFIKETKKKKRNILFTPNIGANKYFFFLLI